MHGERNSKHYLDHLRRISDLALSQDYRERLIQESDNVWASTRGMSWFGAFHAFLYSELGAGKYAKVAREGLLDLVVEFWDRRRDSREGFHPMAHKAETPYDQFAVYPVMEGYVRVKDSGIFSEADHKKIKALLVQSSEARSEVVADNLKTTEPRSPAIRGDAVQPVQRDDAPHGEREDLPYLSASCGSR